MNLSQSLEDVLEMSSRCSFGFLLLDWSDVEEVGEEQLRDEELLVLLEESVGHGTEWCRTGRHERNQSF